MIHKYKNGNYMVYIDDLDGTKERITFEDDFIPEFPECMDVNISTICGNTCPWCYANCNPNGKHADLKKYLNRGFFDGIHPYTEIAININSEWHPDLIFFLEEMKQKNIIVNATIHQADFEKNKNILKELSNKKLIYGLGISMKTVTEDFCEEIQQFPNAILHLINGITRPDQFKELSDYNLKILILGYKEIGRGKEYYGTKGKEKNKELIQSNQKWTDENLIRLTNHFQIISFDNLALEQLNVKKIISPKDFEEHFLGNDGSFSFYLDLVNDRFSLNSLKSHDETYPIGEKSIKECFDFVRSHKNLK